MYRGRRYTYEARGKGSPRDVLFTIKRHNYTPSELFEFPSARDIKTWLETTYRNVLIILVRVGSAPRGVHIQVMRIDLRFVGLFGSTARTDTRIISALTDYRGEVGKGPRINYTFDASHTAALSSTVYFVR